MVATTLVGVLVFVASVGPGYVYVKVAERWRPYVERTALREAAEITVTGSIATSVGTLVALIVGKWTHFLNVVALSNHPGRYVVRHPGDASLGVSCSWPSATGWLGSWRRTCPDEDLAFTRTRRGTRCLSVGSHPTTPLSRPSS